MRVDYDKDQLAYALANALKERNEARIDAQKSKAYKRVLKETNLRQTERIRYLEGATNHACGTPLSVALRERDEAREEVNKLSGAYEDATNYYARIIELKEELDDARENLNEEMKFHHRTHAELIQTQCKLLDMEMKCDQLQDEIKLLKEILNLIKKDVS
jgi:chemotaxis regulatin CheY-phosphate phosphatase CheZ